MGNSAGLAAAAGIQAAASIAIAQLQYKSEKEKLDLQREIWETQKEWAKMYHDLWFQKYRPVEIAFLDYAANKVPYKPQYDAAESRAVVAVRREFSIVRDKLRKCIDPRCIGEYCHSNKVAAIEEAKAAVAAVNRGFRAEEARKDTKDAQWEALMLSVLQLGRGLSASASDLLGNASKTAAAAASTNPYGGYAAALGNIAGMSSTLLTQGGGGGGSRGYGNQWGSAGNQKDYAQVSGKS